jgi:hypothetical protein
MPALQLHQPQSPARAFTYGFWSVRRPAVMLAAAGMAACVITLRATPPGPAKAAGTNSPSVSASASVWVCGFRHGPVTFSIAPWMSADVGMGNDGPRSPLLPYFSAYFLLSSLGSGQWIPESLSLRSPRPFERVAGRPREDPPSLRRPSQALLQPVLPYQHSRSAFRRGMRPMPPDCSEPMQA